MNKGNLNKFYGTCNTSMIQYLEINVMKNYNLILITLKLMNSLRKAILMLLNDFILFLSLSISIIMRSKILLGELNITIILITILNPFF